MEKCAKEGCTFKKSINAYCGKHQAHYFLEATQSEGLKVCANYIRGCRVQNAAEYRFFKCADCLQKDRDKDKTKRTTHLEVEEGKKKCSACLQVCPIDQFQGKRGETSTCNACRESNKRADAKRDKDHVHEIARKNAKKPERKAVKQAWKEKNVEKVATYWIDARKRLIENDLEGYLKKNAEQAKKWREANPEKVKETNQDRNDNIEYHYTTYKRSAQDKRLDFTIPEEDFMTMVKNPCYYCGILQEKGFNGIDRLDSTQYYTIENCVSCCEMCNMMKGSAGPNIFVHRVEHILTNLQIVQGKLYPEDFCDAVGSNYSQYKNRAIKKELEFEISKDLFSIKRENPCYICGKLPSDIHQNGIDRVDNTKGYTEENTQSCCWSCNYMKKNYDYDIFLNKLMLIYENQKIKPISDHLNKEISNIVTGNKLTIYEKKEIKTTRKKEHMDALREKYINEETKKLWISDIVKSRLDQKI